MKFSLVVLAGLCLFSVNSFAQAKNLVRCDWSSFESATNILVIHEDVGGQLVALYTSEGPGDSLPTLAYPVRWTPDDLTGTNTKYVGQGVGLNITREAEGKGFVSYVSIPKQEVHNVRVVCEFINN